MIEGVARAGRAGDAAHPPASTSADGEVVVTGAPVPTGQVERRRAVTVLWMHPPAGGLRTALRMRVSLM
jgi:hypothetical protein